MRKILIKLVIVIVLAAVMGIVWLMFSRQISMFVDGYSTIEMDMDNVHSVIYEGDGNGGTLVVNDLRLNLDPADQKVAKPHIGTDKQGNLALSFGGKVFPFGPLQATPESTNAPLAAVPDSNDNTLISIRHSALDWVEPFQFSFVFGQAPSRKRHIHYQLLWKKLSGERMELRWRYEQHLISGNDWGSGFMTREGETGLIRVEISGPTQ